MSFTAFKTIWLILLIKGKQCLHILIIARKADVVYIAITVSHVISSLVNFQTRFLCHLIACNFHHNTTKKWESTRPLTRKMKIN